jgi:hypothetical protein
MHNRDLLIYKSTPFCVLHKSSGQLSSLTKKDKIVPVTSSLLCGIRGMRYPFLSLSSRRLTKSCRHVLSQMVVAGTMTVQPPFIPDQPA